MAFVCFLDFFVVFLRICLANLALPVGLSLGDGPNRSSGQRPTKSSFETSTVAGPASCCVQAYPCLTLREFSNIFQPATCSTSFILLHLPFHVLYFPFIYITTLLANSPFFTPPYPAPKHFGPVWTSPFRAEPRLDRSALGAPSWSHPAAA